MAKIDDLPSKVFHLILRYLDMMERIRLRSVSKTFKKNVDEILGEQTDLVVSSDYTINNRWYHSNEPFSIRDHLILTIDLDLAASFGFNKLKRIKLKAGLQESGLQLLAEKFKKLVQVEVGWLNLKNDATVRFDELQILWIGRIYGAKKFSLTLDAPLLRSVYFGEFSPSFSQQPLTLANLLLISAFRHLRLCIQAMTLSIMSRSLVRPVCDSSSFSWITADHRSSSKIARSSNVRTSRA